MERTDAAQLTANTIRGTAACTCKKDYLDADGTCKDSEPES